MNRGIPPIPAAVLVALLAGGPLAGCDGSSTEEQAPAARPVVVAQQERSPQDQRQRRVLLAPEVPMDEEIPTHEEIPAREVTTPGRADPRPGRRTGAGGAVRKTEARADIPDSPTPQASRSTPETTATETPQSRSDISATSGVRTGEPDDPE
ncbi:hypothetical protein [Actinoplanes sp. NPDC051851]|uniref:hypothetical protein n=1 Tax=Actinoplanes sp. NPDC051851 TaxID=3154753 RepID=UPI00341BE62B